MALSGKSDYQPTLAVQVDRAWTAALRSQATALEEEYPDEVRDLLLDVGVWSGWQLTFPSARRQAGAVALAGSDGPRRDPYGAKVPSERGLELWRVPVSGVARRVCPAFDLGPDTWQSRAVQILGNAKASVISYERGELAVDPRGRWASVPRGSGFGSGAAHPARILAEMRAMCAGLPEWLQERDLLRYLVNKVSYSGGGGPRGEVSALSLVQVIDDRDAIIRMIKGDATSRASRGEARIALRLQELAARIEGTDPPGVSALEIEIGKVLAEPVKVARKGHVGAAAVGHRQWIDRDWLDGAKAKAELVRVEPRGKPVATPWDDPKLPLKMAAREKSAGEQKFFRTPFSRRSRLLTATKPTPAHRLPKGRPAVELATDGAIVITLRRLPSHGVRNGTAHR